MSMKGIGKYRIVALATVVVALAAALAGTVEARNNSPPTASPATSNLALFQVQVRDFSYAPNTLTAAVNDPVTITVTNAGPSAHTFTIAGLADSGAIPSGQTRNVQFTPTRAGDLTFFCTIHGQATMSGRISVTAAATNPAQPPAQPPAAQPPAAQQPPVQQPAQPPRQIMQPPSTGDGGLLSIYGD